jgi:tetraacyldisaccharide 4'-kinase
MSVEPTLEVPGRPRSPWQRFYERVHRLRRDHYSSRSRRLPIPVVSVGNLHFGGTGKTPLVAAIATHLQKAGRQVVVVSRGYGRRSRGIHVVSIGDGLIGNPLDAGDEPAMLASVLQGVQIVVGTDRYEAGCLALESLDPYPDVVLLDDGFSHVQLARDLDLLVFPHHDVFAGGRLPPLGSLREPLAAAAAATAVVVTGIPEPPAGGGARVAAALGAFGFEGPGFGSAISAELDPPLPRGEPVLLVTGTASSSGVASTAALLGLEVRHHLAFRDHHPYPRRSLERIERARIRVGARHVVTTSKDMVKLHGRIEPTPVVIRIEARPEPAFWRWLDQADSISKSGSPPSTD